MLNIPNLAELRQHNPDTILIFRVSPDLYQCFDHDAILVSAMLDLECTIDGGRTTCDIPATDLELCLGRLVATAERAAVCEVVADREKAEVKSESIERAVVSGDLKD